MMTSILNLETRDLADAKLQSKAGEDPAPQAFSDTSDYEIVLGRAQIASWLFVGIIAIVVCSSLAYLMGEKIAARNTALVSLTTGSAPPPPAAIADTAALPEATVITSATENEKPPEPLFAEPEMRKVYIQIGAVERGMAMLLAEGLRTHGFDAFVAPGPNDKIFRVLIGPLPDPAAFRQAMVTVNALDLANFARKYQK